MKKSIVDIGSNTIIHLIWDLSLDQQVVENVYVCQLGKSNDSHLDEKSKNKAIQAFETITEVCKEKGINIVKSKITATEWARHYTDGAIFIKTLEEKFEIKINLISGEEEARLCFLGILSSPSPISFPLGLIDMGGSSTEVILAENESKYWSHSFKFGAVKLNNLSTLEEVSKVISRELKEIPIDLLGVKRSWVVACGTIVALMKCIRGELETLERDKYGLEEIKDFINQHDQYNPEELKIKYPHLEERSQSLLTGARILLGLMEFVKADSFQVSERGLRHGVLYHCE